MTIEVLEKTIPKPITSYRKEQILDSLVKEIPQRTIASQHSISQPRISKINQENREVITQRKQELLSQLPNVVESVTKDVETNGKLSIDFSKNIDNLTIGEKLQLKAQLDKTNVNILKIAGIFPSNALLNFNQFNQDNRQINIEPSIMKLFSSSPGGFSDNMEAVDMEEVSDDDDRCDNVDNP